MPRQELHISVVLLQHFELAHVSAFSGGLSVLMTLLCAVVNAVAIISPINLPTLDAWGVLSQLDVPPETRRASATEQFPKST